MLTTEKKVDKQLRVGIPRSYFEKLDIEVGETVLVSCNVGRGIIEIYKNK